MSIDCSCQTLDGPAIQLSVSCSSRAVSAIIELYRNDAQISKTIQIVNVDKVFVHTIDDTVHHE
jgi:hypothetical protein